MDLVHEPGLAPCPPVSWPRTFLRPLLSSRPLKWNGIVAEVFRARDVDFVAMHSEHLVSLQLRGSVDLLQHTTGASMPRSVRAGNVHITPAGAARHWRYAGDSEVLVLRLAPAIVESIASADGTHSAGELEIVEHSGIRDAHIEYVGARLLDELKVGRIANRRCAESLASVLAIHLLRHYSTARGAAADPASKLARHKLHQATDYINKNLRNDLSLGKISETLCMSPCHFAHVFKQTTGLAPHRYVIECRMERAKALLRESDLPVNEVAQMVGYSSQSHFSTVFRQFTGNSPLRYRGDA